MNRSLGQPPAALGRLLAAGLAGILACSTGEPADSRPGSLEVEWTGSDTGKLSAPAVAEWCDGLKLLELRAIHGDTGIGVVLYPAGPSSSRARADSIQSRFFARSDSAAKADSVTRGDSVTPGKYPVITPERADSSRPAAALAMRWFAETSIRGFRGESGTVVIDSLGPGRSAGRLSAYLHSATEGSRLTVTGSFKGLSVTRAPESCVGRPLQESDEPEMLDEPEEPEPPESAD